MAHQDNIAPLEPVAPKPATILVRRALRNVSLMASISILTLIVICAIFAPQIATHDPYLQDLANRFVVPFWMKGGSWDHILGTDHLGRDYFSRLIYGARISLMIGLFTVLVSGTIGTALGLSAGYFGGRVDALVMFLITVRLSMPVLLVALAVVSLYGGTLKVVIGVLGLLLWDRFAVVIRTTTQQIRSQDYITSAEAMGCSPLRIMIQEVLPNLMNNLIVIATLEMAAAIITEAGLSFLGLGVPPPEPSWGLMIAEGKNMLLFMPWVITLPGIALFTLVFAINMVGDGIRDVTTPESRN